MSVAQTAFNILNKTVEDVSKSKFTSAPPTGTNAIHPIETSINWTYSEDGSRGKSPITTELTSMADVVSIMVPLLMTSPIISGNMTELMTLVALMGDAKDHVELYRFTPFKAFFCMHTSKFAAPSTVQDVSSLSGGLSMGLLSRDRLIYGVKESSNGARFSSSNTAEAYGNTEEVMRQLGLKMQGWVYEEGAVIVKCGLYVWTVITLATILVIGGLGIGFGVGNRIKGVDPFNVTTYAWVLAAFLILVCKSARVDNWSWRDFLHRRVQCRSVSELHSVTNIDEQLIMAKLLHDEYNTILTTRGPYNTVFRKKSEHGFSIDRPLDIRTMLLSGLIMFKVITPEGHALVCLDVRRGTSLSVLEHRSLETDKKHLVCRGIDRVSSSIGQDGVKRLRLPLVNSTLRWKTVLGVYTKFDALTV